MKKIITIFTIIFSIISLYGCNTINPDDSIIYNGVKYNSLRETNGFYNFLGDSHKVGIYYTSLGYRFELHCLNSDVEQNILFNPTYDGINGIWVKEGYLFPDESTFIESIIIKKNNEEKKIDLESRNFNSFFTKTTEVEYEHTPNYPCIFITLNYEKNIQYSNYIYLVDEDNLFMFLHDYTNQKFYTFKLIEECKEEFKSYITELKIEDNVEE